QQGDGKFTVRAGNSPMSGEAPPMQSLAKLMHAPLKDSEGKPAGEIEDLLIDFPAAKIAAVVIKFDPKWLDMTAAAAVPPSSIEIKDDALIVKFSASDVRPAGPGGKPAPPPPPQPVPVARLTHVTDGSVPAEARSLLGTRIANPSGDPV